MTTCELGARAGARLPSTAGRSRRWLREVGLLALLYVAYSAARLLGDATMPTALAHARDLLAVEQLLHLNIEGPANAALQAVPPLALAASYWYSLLHYVVTPAVMIWAYRSHHTYYRHVRDSLVVGSAIGLVGFTLVPMAPPRMLPGFVDTLASTASLGWWGSDAQRAARARRPHEPARGDAVAARRLGGLGRLGRLPAGQPAVGAAAGRRLPRRDDAGRRLDGQPLPARRGRGSDRRRGRHPAGPDLGTGPGARDRTGDARRGVRGRRGRTGRDAHPRGLTRRRRSAPRDGGQDHDLGAGRHGRVESLRVRGRRCRRRRR